MHDFLIGLQFLTRIRFVSQTQWTPESFGRSVKFFPAVGAVLGLILAGAALLSQNAAAALGVTLPPHAAAALFVALPILLTGGLHTDGFMDTMDGIFSGRPKEKMLEIMKDSRVGANGVTAFALLILCKWSLLVDLPPAHTATALFVMPVVSRMAMVMGIALFPYARPEGIGKAFAEYAGGRTLPAAFLLGALFLLPCGTTAAISAAVAAVFALLFCRYVTKVLGGLTGDVYGALTELSEVLSLLVFVAAARL